MKRFFRPALGGLAMLATMLLSAALTLRIALHGHEVRIPDFSGMTVAEASTAALQTGVDLNIENRFYSTTVPAGRVLSQAPAAGSTVRHGWQVRVTESLGPQQVTIPDVVGQPLRQASMGLRRMSLDLGTLAHMDAPGDPDMTLAQTPPPNAGVDQPRVNLLLSSSAGSADNAVVMPSYVGWSFPAANRAAIGLGLRVAAIVENPAPAPAAPAAPGSGAAVPVGPNGVRLDGGQTASPEPPPLPTGPVSAQSPQSGFRASRGDVIRMYIGHVPASLSQPGSSTATAAPIIRLPPGTPVPLPAAPPQH